MAGDYQGYGVVPYRIAHGLRRHPFQNVFAGDGMTYLTVSYGFIMGCGEKNLPYKLVKRRAFCLQQRGEIGLLAGEMDVESAAGLRKNRQFVL